MEQDTIGNHSYLTNLPVEILYKIFDYCNLTDLLRTSQTCTRLNCIVSDVLTKLHRRERWMPLITNQNSAAMRDRSNRPIDSLLERLRISHNWRIGKYKELIQLKYKTAYMPWLYLEKDHIWVGQGFTIVRYKRNSGHGRWRKATEFLVRRGETNKFVVGERMLITGTTLGAVCVWDRELPKQPPVFGFNFKDVHAVDIGPNTLCSGTREHSINIWAHPELNSEVKAMNPIGRYVVRDRIWSLKYNKTGSLAIGTGGIYETALLLLDLETEQLKSFGQGIQRPGAGILDIHWLDENCLYTCGYDSYVHLWDHRTGNRVASWLEPHNSVLYCIQTDGLHSILCGTQRHGKVTLWDKRQRKSLQMYYLSTYQQSSPVFSLAFDTTTLFGALDHSINALYFAGNKSQIRNYSSFVI